MSENIIIMNSFSLSKAYSDKPCLESFLSTPTSPTFYLKIHLQLTRRLWTRVYVLFRWSDFIFSFMEYRHWVFSLHTNVEDTLEGLSSITH